MESNNHTQGEWVNRKATFKHRSDSQRFEIINPATNCVLADVLFHNNEQETEANAKLIVKAVNNHEKLIEALKECYSLLEEYNEGIPNNAKIARVNALNLLESIKQQ